MTRIDHAARAGDYIKWAHEVQSAQVENAVLAQVEATLALVEQQQIANLIALGILDIDEMPETGERGLIYSPPDDTRNCPDIASALGIGGDSDE